MNVLKGTMILSVSMWISKLLGFVYIIPFLALVGLQGNILYEYAYKPYAILLSVSSLGIPVAISQFTSKYNQLGAPYVADKMFRFGVWGMLGTGAIGASILLVFSPSIASLLVEGSGGASGGNNIEDIVYVIRMVSPALFIVPCMSVLRGYFQGHGDMMPTAISQVVEQFVRVGAILLSAYLIINIHHGSVASAVGMATFSATIGAVASLFILLVFLYRYQKRRKEKNENEMKKEDTASPRMTNLVKELASYAIPIVLASLAIPMYQLIETYSINGALMASGYTQGEAETTNSIVSLVQKLILIPVGLASAFGLTLVPAITDAITKKDEGLITRYITKTCQALCFLLFPVMIVIMVFAPSIFGVLFGMTHMKEGGVVTLSYTPTLFLYASFIVTSAILQGIKKHTLVLISLGIGILLKLGTNYFFTFHFEAYGAILSTNIGFTLSVILNLYYIRRYTSFSIRRALHSIRSIGLISLSLVVFSLVVKTGVSPALSSLAPFWHHALLASVGGGVSVLFFFLLSKKMGLLSIITKK